MVASETEWEDTHPASFFPWTLVDMLGRNRHEAHNMPYYLSGVVVCALLWALLYKICHYLSPLLWKTYSTLSNDKQAEWDSRIVSNVNAILMCFDMAFFLPWHSGVRESAMNPSVTTPPLLVTVLMMRFVGYMLYDFCLMMVTHR